MAYRSFEDLEVWKSVCDLAVKVYELLKNCSDYGLKNQMTRSAVSIASNIAEGAERNSAPDFIRFLHIAKGSAAELRTQSMIAARIGELTQEEADILIAATRRLGGQLQSLAKSLKPKT